MLKSQAATVQSKCIQSYTIKCNQQINVKIQTPPSLIYTCIMQPCIITVTFDFFCFQLTLFHFHCFHFLLLFTGPRTCLTISLSHEATKYVRYHDISNLLFNKLEQRHIHICNIYTLSCIKPLKEFVFLILETPYRFNQL